MEGNEYRDDDYEYVVMPSQEGPATLQLKKKKKNIPIVTIIIVLMNVIAAVMCIGVENYTRTGGLNYEYVVQNKEYGRLLSSMFLHSGFSHLMGNMFTLVMFGMVVEKRLGALRMTIIYFVSGIVSGLISMNMSHMLNPDGVNFSIGASGAVFGIMCACVFLSVMGDKKANRRDMIIAIILVVIYAVYSYKDNVDIFAHIGGAIAGGILAFVLNVKNWESFRENKFLRVVGIIMTVALSIAAIGEARIGKSVVDLEDKRIDYIKDQTIFNSSSAKFGEILDGFCTDEHWIVFKSEDGDNIVEFDADAEYKGQKVSVLIQFRLIGDCENYKIGYFGINDEPQNNEGAAEFMSAACERAGYQ